MEAKVAATGKSLDAVLSEASGMLSGLTHAAGVVMTAKANVRLKHIEFVRLEPERALVVMVAEDGQVENRIIDVPIGLPTSALTEAGELPQCACARAHAGRGARRSSKSALTAKPGRARSIDAEDRRRRLRELVGRRQRRPQADRARARQSARRPAGRSRTSSACGCLFDDLETKRGVIDLLGRAEGADGARIFIGSENKLFSLSGSSTIVAPYRDGSGRIIGVIGVIGPTRLNYARVIPMVDYTAKVVSKLIGG